jgi:hypothetical protein
MSIYTNTARFDGTARALSNDDLHRLAPSVFATTAHDSRSERFVPVPTITVLEALRNEGFSVVGAKQSLTRIPGKAPFTKHMLRLRKLDQDARYSVGDNVFEVLLKNANDGTSAYDLMAGLFRIRCLNSLVSQTANTDSVKVRHSGHSEDVATKVIEGTYRVLENAETLLTAPQDWGRISLNDNQRMAYAMAAHTLRFDTETDEQVNNHAIKANTLLLPRRTGDSQPDLWSTFNVVQENCLKGGLHGRSVEPMTRRGYRRVTTRPIKGIDQDIKLNKALWALTAKMAELAA